MTLGDVGTDAVQQGVVEPGPLVLVAAVAGIWLWALRRLAPAHAPDPAHPVDRRQVACFVGGVLGLLVALEGPVHSLGEGYLFSVHMLQHLVVSMVAAPLLLLGTPGWMLRVAVGTGTRLRAARALVRPLPAFILFNAMLVFSHWPVIVGETLGSEPAHAALHVALLAVSFVMWMPVVSPLPELPRLSAPANLGYLFLQSILPTVPASFLTFGDSVLYRFYEDVPRLWGTSPIGDQQVSGLLMKVGAGFLLWAIIAVLFFVWQAEEEPEARPPGIDFDDLELELTKELDGSAR